MAELNAEPSDRRSGRFVPGRWLPAALVAVAVLVSFGIGWVSMSDWANDRAVEDLLELPPLVAPVASTSDAAGVRGDAEVLGVSVDGRHRAYVVATMVPIREHVVNDLIGGAPLTMTYCDRTDCVRAYTESGRSTRLDLAVGGWLRATGRNGMLLRSGRHRYLQSTGQSLDGNGPQLPYQEVKVRRTTWAKWRADHPDTDVYIGGALEAQ